MGWPGQGFALTRPPATRPPHQTLTSGSGHLLPRPPPPPSGSVPGSTAPPATRLCTHALAGHLRDGAGEGVTPPKPPLGPEAPPPAPQHGAGLRDTPRPTAEDATYSGAWGRGSAHGQLRGAAHGRAGAMNAQPQDGTPPLTRMGVGTGSFPTPLHREDSLGDNEHLRGAKWGPRGDDRCLGGLTPG